MKQTIKLLLLKLFFPGHVNLASRLVKVIGGPFAGMACPIDVAAGKLLGTYENELHDIVTRLLAMQLARVINIGAGDGYYTVGFAIAHPARPTIIAFEAEEEPRDMLMRIAKLNSCRPITLKGRCESPAVAEALSGPGLSLIICDVEGYEMELLDPVRIPSLRDAVILVEVHDFVDGTIYDALVRRFEETHQLSEILTRERTTKDLPTPSDFATLLPRQMLLSRTNEGRPGPMRWLWMVPKKQG